MRKKKITYSGIGGQAVLEGIMMKNQDACSVAVRRQDGKIEVKKFDTKDNSGKLSHKIPFVRGVFQFAESLKLGMKALNLSAEYYAEEEDEPTALDKAGEKAFGEGAESVLTTVTLIFSVAVAIGLFIVVPYLLANLLAKVVAGQALLALLEGLIRLCIFLLYIVLITAMKDIRRVYQYHGAEHKCINCIEHGRILDVKNVRLSSRYHRRCGTSFLLFVMVISIIVFFFIKVDQPVLRVLLRLALIPVIAGISYEIIRLAGRSESIFVRILSAPGMWLQRLTTKEPDDAMIEVAIAAVESVFDWKNYLKETFDFDVDEYERIREEEDLLTGKMPAGEDEDLLPEEEPFLEPEDEAYPDSQDEEYPDSQDDEYPEEEYPQPEDGEYPDPEDGEYPQTEEGEEIPALGSEI